MIALTVYLGYVVERANFPAFISAYGLFFALYVWLLTRPGWTAADRRFFIGLGIVLRVLLLFSIPNLSDDFYRFLWDGRLAAQGIHPFAHPPVFFMENEIRHAGITPELFSKLNSPEYYTVYPPVCQGVFWLAAVLFPKSVAGGVFVFKVFLVVCELGIIGLLGGFRLSAPPLRHSASLGYACRHSRQPHSQPLPKRKGSRDVHRRLHHLPVQIFKKSGQLYGSPPSWGGVGGGVDAATLYALNPLILLEITGNAHFEGAMLCFLLAGILMLQRGRLVSAAGFWALATDTKLVRLLFIALVWGAMAYSLGATGLLAGAAVFVVVWRVFGFVVCAFD